MNCYSVLITAVMMIAVTLGAAVKSGLDFVDPMIGTEGSGTEYGGTMPAVGVPFGSMHVVPVTRTNGISRTSFNSADTHLLGFILSRQPAIWMGEWGAVRIWLDKPLPIESINATPYFLRVNAGGRMYEATASAHSAFFCTDDTRFGMYLPREGSSAERTERTSTQPMLRFRNYFRTEKCNGLLKIGVSLISRDNARLHLDRELRGGFDAVVARTRREWEGLMKRIEINASENVKRIFYTGIYHALLCPRELTECDGRHYSGVDDRVHNGTGWTCFSLWDTYRAAHPLYTLLVPERVDGMMRALVDMSRRGGCLPLHPNPGYTGQMVGGPAEVVLAEAAVKGFRGFDIHAAWEAVLRNAQMPQPEDLSRRWPGTFGDPKGTPEARAGLSRYMADGYVSVDETDESVSRTLDYSLDDAACSSFARVVGKKDWADHFASRSKNYTNLWNAAEKRFMPRRKDGVWFLPSEGLRFRRAYTETNEKSARWCVPHDVQGLVALMGGRDTFLRELDHFFENDFFVKDTVGNVSVHGNETVHHVAYMYNHVGAYDKTCRRVRDILTKCYSSSRKGFDGNEDCGQMSAWYVLSALGIYPLNPASGMWELGTPLVESAVLRFGSPYKPALLNIKVKNYAPDRWLVKRVTLNGVSCADRHVSHSDLIKGGVLEFEMDIGETNLVRNSGFNLGSKDWALKERYKVCPEGGLGNSSVLAYDNQDPMYYSVPGQRIVLKSGFRYRFSAEVRTDDLHGSGTGAGVCLEWVDKNGKWLGGAYSKCIKGSSGWTRLEGITEVIPDAADKCFINPYVRKGLVGKAWFDDICVVPIVPKPIGAICSSAYRNRAASGSVTFSVLPEDCATPDPAQVVFSWIDAKGKRQFAPAKSGLSLTLPVKNLKLGFQRIRAEAPWKGGQCIAEVDFTRDEAPRHNKVWFDKQGRTVVDGKLFFPLGMYWYDLSRDKIELYANGPFNCLMPYISPKTSEMMDLCHDKGLKVIYSVKDIWSGTKWAPKGIDSEADETAFIMDRVERFKNHPSLLAWYTNDELPVTMMPRLIERRNFLERLDPDHPCWTVLCQHDRVMEYLHTFDVVGTDPYPVPLRPLSMSGVWTQEAKCATGGCKPLWMVPQACDLGAYETDLAERNKRRAPTEAELRSMCWQCIAAGANGLILYSWFDLWKKVNKVPFAVRWAECRRVGEEIQRYFPVLLSDEITPPKVSAGLFVRTWRKNGKIWMLVVNARDATNNAEILFDVDFASVRSSFGPSAVKIAHGLKVSLGAYEPAMYILSGK